MKKFGLGRKNKGEKGSSENGSAAVSRTNSSNSNPYAQAQEDPYAPSPPAYNGGGVSSGSSSFRDNKTPAYTTANGGSGAAVGGGRFGAAPVPTGYGGGGGSGGSRYGGEGAGGDAAANAPASGAATAGGYGAAPAEGRYGQQSAMQAGAERDAASQWQSGTGPAYGQGGNNQGYGAYEDRQLTEEEQEEQDVLAAKDEIKFIKQSDVSSTRNALRIAAMAEETGRSTLERLGAQGERIHNTERNLDLASNQNKLAAEKAREISTLNRSMFAVHVANPFTSGKRIKERESEVLRDAKEDRERRDATRLAAWSTQARANDVGKEINKAGMNKLPAKGSLAERSKYQFEADSEDEEMENEIDNNVDLLHGAAGRLGHLARAMGQEVDSQNKHIERIGGKVDKVDDEIALNRNRLDRIH
ncbi:hypothetical protein EJ08DRAFT_684915 [Tothia fuscella]|uniref:Protein transport protein SEC9 n=1 Tax=Tothia fuscella TaxID=1048955 RepID=A0A9P4P3D8_9PEZI|nr:hypothetical protein EJ08DRAFT_684915 [Tothia fuscella]